MSWLNGKGVAPRLFKEGKGVDKNEPEKKGFFKFFDIVWAKLGKFVQTNLLYVGLSILWLAALYFILPIGYDLALSIANGDEMVASNIELTLRSVFALIVFNLIGNPLIAPSYAFITRCFTRGEPVWIWSDGLDIFKQNFKQSLALFLIDIVVTMMSINGVIFYYMQYAATGTYVWLLLLSIFCAVLFVYITMHYYIYQIMIAFECSFMQLIKNAMICTIANLPMTVVFTLISIGIILGLGFIVSPIIIIFFNITVGLCLTRYPMEFYASRVIRKKIKQQEKQLKRNKARITYTGEDK